MVVSVGAQKYKLVPIKKRTYAPSKPFLPRRFGKAEFKSDRPVYIYRR
jgi:hypothetical protein